jgi:hypothetical protein
MMFLRLLVAFAMFTLMDAVNTTLGLSIGLAELNPIVAVLGLPAWILFRIALLTIMITAFFTGYKLCVEHFRKGTRVLETILLMLNIYIGVVVFMGFIAILKITL